MSTTDWQTIVIAVSAISYLLLAGAAFWRRKYRPRAAIIMVVYALISFIWIIMQVSWQPKYLWGLVDEPVARLPVYVSPILAMLLLFLSRAFLLPQLSGRKWSLVSIVWAAGAIVLEAFFWRSGLFQVAALHMITLALCGLGWLIFMGGATILTLRQLSPRATTRYQTAATYWLIVILLTVAGDALFIANLPIPANLLRLAGTLLAVAVISQPHLVSIGHILRHSLSYTVYLAAALIFYTIGLTLLLLALQNWSSLSLILTGLVLALALVIIFNPLLSKLRAEINLWIAGDKQDPTYILRQYSQTITNILDLKLLAAVAVGTASEFLEVDRGYLFLVEYEKDADGKPHYLLRGVKGKGGDNPEPMQLREQCALVMCLKEEQLPVTQSEIDFQPRFKDISPEERAWLSSLEAEVYVPIFAKNEWIGLLVLGSKTSGGAYTEHDLFLLSTMSDQTAVALENTRLVDGLVRLNAEFRRAYAALDQANRHLERLDRTKSDFISIASHELRTPLTLIRGSSQMLLDEPALQENSYYSQLLSKIEKGTDRLHEIIDSLLDVAKIDSRALELEPQAISPRELIHAVYKTLRPSAIERQQTIDMQGLDGLPSITADAAALRKVFYHLLVNAIKYTPDGGSITISGQALASDASELPGGGIEIVISDTGIGIDPRYQELIFAKFYQTGELGLHSTGKTKFKGGGPGLGLAIVYGIVEAHHGKVWVESPGHDEEKCPGSKFHVILPIHQDIAQIPQRTAGFVA
jgi:signal transduction histidine kinase